MRSHLIKVGQMLEQLKKEIREQKQAIERAIYEQHEERVGS